MAVFFDKNRDWVESEQWVVLQKNSESGFVIEN